MAAYSYFKKVNGRWERKSSAAFSPRSTAVRYFQDKLIWEGGEIRQVKETPKKDPYAGECQDCRKHLHSKCKGCACACAQFKQGSLL